MPARIVMLAAMFAIGACAAPASAQAPDPMQARPGAQPEQGLEAGKGMLSTEERDLAREAVREDDTVEAPSPEGGESAARDADEAPVVVGKPLPPTLAARLAPVSLTEKLPARPDHEYWIFGGNLALVDKESREVNDIVRDIFQ